MIHLKLYEEHNSKNTPEIGDYIFVDIDKCEAYFNDAQKEYMNSNLGVVIDILDDDNVLDKEYQILYDKEFSRLSNGLKTTPWLYLREILWFGKEKESTEMLSQSKNYNL